MQYKPLDDTKHEIRVLRFLNLSKSSSPQERIQCSIENVPLDDVQKIQSIHGHLQNQQHPIWWDLFTKDVDLRDSSLEQTTLDPTIYLGLTQNHNLPGAFRYSWGDFEALSYTWGDRDDARKILLNGICKEVSSNLEGALRTLRDLPETRLGMRYWVDSLCIDQENINERNHQVKRMRDIYSRARAVIVWLGREEKADRNAVQAMRHLCRNPCMEYPPNLLLDGWNDLCTFMRKPYWNRSWIIQELAMNHNSTLVLCGKLKLTRRMIRLGAVFCQELLQAEEDQSNHHPESDVWSIASRMYRLVSLTFDPYFGESLDKLLTLVRRADATDKKDKVYGILGLLDTAVSSEIIPDYSLLERQVYTKFMMSLVNATQRLEQIIYGGISVEEGWPSWVPDWRLPFERHHIRYLRRHQASGNLPASIQFSRNDKNDLLICSGFKVGMVDGVGARPSLSSGIAPPNNASKRYGSGIPNALWRTLLMDHPGTRGKNSLLDVPWTTELDSIPSPANFHLRTKLGELSRTSYFQKFHEFREANEELRIGGQSFRDFFPQSSGKYMDTVYIIQQMRLAVLSLKGRTLITTTTGYLGLAPESVRQGDVVAILLGCNCPVVIRPCGNLYNIIGECYVHGLMNGEFFRPENREDTLQQEFILC